MKREYPVSFEEFRYFVKNYVKYFNKNASDEFLYDKYKIYESNVPIPDPNTSHKRIGIYSQYNTKIEYYTSRGWNYSEAQDFIYKRQSITSKESFIERYGNKHGTHKFKRYIEKHSQTYRKNLKRGLHKSFYRPSQIEYWMNKGYKRPDAKRKMFDFYSYYAKKFHEDKRNKGEEFLTHWQLKFWLKRGYSILEAKKQLSRIHDTRSLQSCMNRYGEKEGYKKFKEINEKWQRSLNNKSEEEKSRILLKKLKNFPRYSYKSINLFESVLNFLYQNYGIFFEKVYMGEKEKFIYDTLNQKIYFYDFYIPYVNLIIEYHGAIFHPNSNHLSKEEWNNWKNPLSKTNADEQYKKDIHKKELAETNGYNFLEVWENETFEENKNKIIEKILKLYYNYGY
ncbi:MAG: hypothetical protein ACOC1O_01510 [bacterium]